MGAGALMQVLHQLPVVKDKDLIVGIETSDDAGVYRVSDNLAVINTLDFFPPIVDDAFTFGSIAAANALSDVYAMGGTPRLAMNIVCFPGELPLDVLADIIKGATDKLNEAGALLIGGHSIEDDEVKFGLSVTGFVDPEKVVTNRGARPGDTLILTKSIGTGVITSALKAGKMREGDAAGALKSMQALNRGASDAMSAVGVNACTDITGYGLLGHAMEMAKGSGADLVINAADVDFFPGAKELVMKRSCRPRNMTTTMEFLKDDVDIASGVDEAVEMLLYDPQTSGGLLISVPGEKEDKLIERLVEKRVRHSVIGRVEERGSGARIKVE